MNTYYAGDPATIKIELLKNGAPFTDAQNWTLNATILDAQLAAITGIADRVATVDQPGDSNISVDFTAIETALLATAIYYVRVRATKVTGERITFAPQKINVVVAA